LLQKMYKFIIFIIFIFLFYNLYVVIIETRKLTTINKFSLTWKSVSLQVNITRLTSWDPLIIFRSCFRSRFHYVLKIEFLNHNDSIAVAMWLIFMITLIYFICRAGIENISVMFAKPDKRASWEESFNEAKQKLGK